MHKWLPVVAKTVGTLYLLEAPAILVLRAIVLMFVPSKLAWTETFHDIAMRTWAVVLAVAALTHLVSGIVGWVIGVRLARHRMHAPLESAHTVVTDLHQRVLPETG